ncbi:MAG: tryptophan--tRNA ligase [Bdellovibrionales bacterium]|nr:tryptophan--tRNA ligase [Bdellovibrionales bacterium]
MNHSTLLTGIKPTGVPHLGNYIGAIQPALEKIQNLKGQSYLFIADYHALTTLPDPQEFKQNVYEVTSAWLACGTDPNKTIIYKQSDIPELFELYWVLSCLTPKGLLNRSHSYKAHIQEKKEDFQIQMGVFNYPILMAADILLFQSDFVPVGSDQLQHLEITRDLAGKFNHTFKTSLMVPPEPLKEEQTSLPGIDGRKMSKSYNNHIPLFCSSEELKKKIMKIKTDSLPPTAPKDPQASIVFQIYKEFADAQQIQDLEHKLKKGCSWGEVKLELFELLEKKFQTQKETYQEFLSNKKKLDQILNEGAVKARIKAKEFMQQVRKTTGIIH